jgi:DNA-binding NarL/FixJ family response regulator
MSRKTYLTRRQVEVLMGAAMGLTSKEISQKLGIEERTVNWHIGGAMRALGTSSRTAAVAKALESGLLERQEGDTP